MAPDFLTCEDDPLDALARRHLLDFTERTHHDYRPAEFHRVMCEYCERWASGEIKRLAIMAPPRHGKTEIVSRRLPAWMMGRSPDIAVMAMSWGATLAEANSRDVQRIIMSDEYRRIFPGTQLNSKNVVSDSLYNTKRTAAEFEIVDHRGRYKCGGASQGFAGMPGQWVIVDDPFRNRADAYSQTKRDAVWNMVVTDLESRMEPPGCLMLMMTRWHEDDIIGRYLRVEGRVEDGGLWTVLEFPAFEDGIGKDRRPYDSRPVGRFLWPGRELEPDESPDEVPDEVLHERAVSARKKRIKRSEDTDAALYQQRPKRPGGNIYKDVWMQNRFRVIPFTGEWFVTCDPKGGSRDPKSSRFVLQLWSKDAPARINLVDQFRGLWSQPECIALLRVIFLDGSTEAPPGSSPEFADVLRKASTRKSMPLWRRAGVKLVEPKADGKSIVATLCSSIPKMRPAESPKSSKEARWMGSTEYWASGNVWLPDQSVIPWTGDWIAEFIAEMTSVPTYPTDDQADAAEIATHYAFEADANADPWAQDHGEDVWAGY